MESEKLEALDAREYFESKKASLNPQPIEGGSLRDFALQLARGYPTTITLEPGDTTRYDLALIPMWGRYMRLGNYGDERQSSLLVVRVVGGHPTGSQVVLLNRSFKELYQISNGNEWTEMLLDWWFDLLWKELAPMFR